MSGAGTSEGWKQGDKYLYSCEKGCYSRWNHAAWIVWCPKCGEKLVGPEVQQ